MRFTGNMIMLSKVDIVVMVTDRASSALKIEHHLMKKRLVE